MIYKRKRKNLKVKFIIIFFYSGNYNFFILLDVAKPPLETDYLKSKIYNVYQNYSSNFKIIPNKNENGNNALYI